MFGRIAGVALLIVVWASGIRAQAQPDTAFEVASVKRVDSPDMTYGIRPIEPSGRFHAIITVRDLIASVRSRSRAAGTTRFAAPARRWSVLDRSQRGRR